jgi:hypothetical protein
VLIHLGGNRMIRIREVIAILDAGSEESADVLFFLERVRKEGKLERIAAEEGVKSYVITDNRVYASPISSLTLKKRAEHSQKTWNWK